MQPRSCFLMETIFISLGAEPRFFSIGQLIVPLFINTIRRAKFERTQSRSLDRHDQRLHAYLPAFSRTLLRFLRCGMVSSVAL